MPQDNDDEIVPSWQQRFITVEQASPAHWSKDWDLMAAMVP
jgi:hypothetical protein